MIINKPETQGLTSFTINVSLLLLCVKALIFIINPDFHWINLLKIFEYSPCRYMISKQFCRIFFSQMLTIFKFQIQELRGSRLRVVSILLKKPLGRAQNKWARSASCGDVGSRSRAKIETARSLEGEGWKGLRRVPFLESTATAQRHYFSRSIRKIFAHFSTWPNHNEIT